MERIAVLGCGNMAQALVKGWASEKDLIHYCYTPSQTRARELAKEVKGHFVATLDELEECDTYLIACKPQQVEELAKSLAGKISSQAVIISVLAGAETSRLQRLFQTKKVLRVMPNTPSLIGEGVSALYFTNEVSQEFKEKWKKLFDNIGLSVVFDKEEQIDIITPFSGSGPAYIFEFARIFTNKMEQMGIPREIAHQMIVQTFIGSSKLMKESSESPEVLRNNVTSKKGVTYEALEVFKDSHLEDIFSKAIESAFRRAKELSTGQ